MAGRLLEAVVVELRCVLGVPAPFVGAGSVVGLDLVLVCEPFVDVGDDERFEGVCLSGVVLVGAA